jgi:CxxC motif-containing protein
MEIRDLICIGCPMGCPLQVTIDGGEVKQVTGNTCPKGDSYARKEVTSPMRKVTSTVFVTDGKEPLVSVKTATEISKDKIFPVMDALRGIFVKAPVKIGDVIVKNVADTGSDIVATGNVAKA